VNAGASAVNAGASAVNAGASAVNAGARTVNAGASAVNGRRDDGAGEPREVRVVWPHRSAGWSRRERRGGGVVAGRQLGQDTGGEGICGKRGSGGCIQVNPNPNPKPR